MIEQTVKHRSGLLDGFCGGLPIRQAFPLIREVELTPGLYAALRQAVGDYLRACLLANGHSVPDYGDYEELVATRCRDILGLPNVTPNGVIRPKLETTLEFSLIHRRVADLVASLGIDSRIMQMRMPLSLRIVDGVAAPGVEHRPRANNKLHSDFWTGGCCDLAFLLPVFGDVAKTTVRFGEGTNLSPDFLQELPSYDDGRALYGEFVPYDMRMRKGFIYFQDILCLHGTSRNGGGPRVSMDWTLQTVNYSQIAGRYSSAALATDNHFPMLTWYELGKRYLYIDGESMNECARRIAAEHDDPVLRLGGAIAGQTAPSAKIIRIAGDGPVELPLARLQPTMS